MKAALRVGLISSIVPKKCGIATFSRDLVVGMWATNPHIKVFSVAAEDPGEGYDYQLPVIAHLRKDNPDSYLAAADKLNKANLDVVLLQHEFGLFGGSRSHFTQNGVVHDDPTGDYVIPLIERLTAPVITTFHTVMPQPDDARREVIRRIGELSKYVVTMSRGTKRILVERYGIAARKIHVIPHGVPRQARGSRLAARQAIGLPLRNTYLTITGLIGPNKGVDLVIKALPAIIKEHPSVRLIVAGQTHPGILAHEGDTYREKLTKLAEDLGVREAILFVNAYLPTDELMMYLRASDIYLTPHRDPEQVASGTLAYALGTGLPAISTPYPYARELLANGRGALVEFDDSKSIADAANRLLSSPALRHDMVRRLQAFRRSTAWPAVAKSYLELIDVKVPAVR